MSEDSVAIVRECFREMHESLDGFLAGMAPQFEYHTLSTEPDAGTYKGPEGFRRLASPWLAEFPDYRYEQQEFIDAGDYVIAVTRARGPGRRSGLEIDAPYVLVWRLQDGIAIECREYVTRDEALKAVGLTP
jgi:ketosteroid isomerase-like protein